jgi:hypothetical protein
LNIEESERKLRNSSMVYAFKSNFYLHGVFFIPCKDCPFQNEIPAVPILEKDKDCFKRCPHDIMIWLLNEEQTTLYEKFRPPEKKKKELEKAIKEGRIIQIPV